jgi:DNA topoisomerase-2
MFNADRRLHKYATVEEVIDEFYVVRMKAYASRKAYLVKAVEERLVKLSNRAKYILETLEGTIDLRRKTKQQVSDLLSSHHYDMIEGNYSYLTKMPMDSVTKENVDAILKEKQSCEEELALLRATTEAQMWISELDAFESVYITYKEQRAKIQNPTTSTTPAKKSNATATKKRVINIRSP